MCGQAINIIQQLSFCMNRVKGWREPSSTWVLKLGCILYLGCSWLKVLKNTNSLVLPVVIN